MSGQAGILHITNGAAAIRLMRRAGLRGDFLSWDDPLHDGPAPAGLSLVQFSRRRAAFLADCGFVQLAQARRRFQLRDETLAAFQDWEEVVLWFEHDLYDQLQLIQILDWFHGSDRGATNLSLIQSGRHLGEIDAGHYPKLLKARQPATQRHLDRGRDAWAAYTSPDPTQIERERDSADDSLPYLSAALLRHLEEFPSTIDGLGRTERQILESVSQGHHDPGSIFRISQGMEEAKFLGDWSFWLQIANLLQGPHPLLSTSTGPFLRPPAPVDLEAFERQRIHLTATGRAALDGLADRVQLNGYKRWLGGALLEPDRLWRWDRSSGRLRGWRESTS